MSSESRTYRQGFAAGWYAASQALMQAMAAEEPAAAAALEMAGSLPAAAKRRGRPPKSLSAPPAVRRPRGRPRKRAGE
jgi:hypothetical protein